MRVLIDTNILFSALLFPKSKPADALMYVAQHHEMILCDQNINELHSILYQKAPKYIAAANTLLAEMSYELIPAIKHTEKYIRDVKDQPILNSAILYNVDVILTGDKDFLSLDLKHPKCMTVSQFFISEGIE